jgi:uncharacterized protein (DUF1810 family)
MQFDLSRFITAQNSDNPHYNYSISNYDSAVEEIEAGKKESHWIWYIFPQIKGLGISYESTYYGLAGIEEAKAYLEHPVLSERLIYCFKLILDIDTALFNVFKYDEIKVWASATLFSIAHENKSELFDLVLEKHFNSLKQPYTLEKLEL